MFIDSHCHLDDPLLADRLPEVLATAARAGVERFVVPGVGPQGWPRIASLVRRERGVHGAFGLHPMHAALFTPALLDEVTRYLPHAVAIGEIGLDHTYVDVPRSAQEAAFRAQLRLAVAHGLPVLIHCRRAFADLLRILREERVDQVGGVMHAFSGSVEIARECLGLGLYVSIAGTVTYANAVRPVEVVRQLPLDRLILETDSPDMTPEPYRGQPNEPAFLAQIALKVAAIKGISAAEVAATTTANAKRLFHLHTTNSHP